MEKMALIKKLLLPGERIVVLPKIENRPKNLKKFLPSM